MNVLTKAFVVVVTVLAVALVALIVPFAARVPDYAQQFEDMKLSFNAQVQKASTEAAQARADMAAKGEALEVAQKQIETLASQLGLTEADKTALQAKIAQAEATVERVVAAQDVTSRLIENKDSQLTEQGELIQKQIGSLAGLQAQIADLSQALIGVRADKRRLSDNFLRIQEENKALVQQLSEAQSKFDDIIKLAKAKGIDLTDGQVVVKPDSKILGSVVKIDQITDELTFVQVNVGTRDQVKEGMEFTVFRGDSFVGTIQIASVDTAESVGRLTLGAGVREGDAVRAGNR